MRETDLGYFGVPNGEQVKSARSRNRPGLRLDFTLSRCVCMVLASSVYVQFSQFSFDARARLRARLQATMTQRDRGRPVDLEFT